MKVRRNKLELPEVLTKRPEDMDKDLYKELRKAQNKTIKEYLKNPQQLKHFKPTRVSRNKTNNE